MLNVLYEDNHLIAVVKPAGMLSQPDKTKNKSLLDEVRAYVKEKYHKKGNVFVGLLHRLDRPVSGVMLFAKTSKGASRLSEQFRHQEVQKTYRALVTGKPRESSGILLNALEKRGSRTIASFGKEAVLHYRVLWQDGKHSLLEIQIESGKFHQIRAQLAKAGLPIVGDIKYGGEKWKDEKSIALCATKLAFTSATGDKPIELSTDAIDFHEKLMR